MRQVAFISSLIDEEHKDKMTYSIASQLYQQKMIRAFHFRGVYSFNIHSRKTKTIKQAGNVFFYQYPANIILRVFFFINYIWSINRRIERETDLLFYNLHNRNFLTLIFFKYIRRLRVFVLVADYASPKRSRMDALFNFFLKKTNGLLVLNKHINIHPNTIVQQLLIEETSGSTMIEYDVAESKKNILFSGSIGLTTGIHIAIEAMRLLPGYTLHISGNLFDITTEQMQKLLSEGSKNIVYHGSLERHPYQQLLSKCRICLSLRDPHNEDHLYNFPSKIGEYLAHKKMVISSLMYDGFEKYISYTQWLPAALAEVVLSAGTNIDASTWLLEKFGFEAFNKNLITLLANEQHA